MDDIAATMGGYVAEIMIYDDLTTGPSNDLSVVTDLARNMVARWGMSDVVGPVAFASDRGGHGEAPYSQAVAAQMDAEVKRIIEEARTKAEEVLTTHRTALDAIAERLVEVETLEREEFEKLLIANGITPKAKEEESLVAEIVAESKEAN